MKSIARHQLLKDSALLRQGIAGSLVGHKKATQVHPNKKKLQKNGGAKHLKQPQLLADD